MRGLLFAIGFIFFDLAASAQAIVPGEILVQMEAKYTADEVVKSINDEIGILPALAIERCVSRDMHIWLCSFNQEEMSIHEMLRLLNNAQGVRIAQANHIIEERITPNDPFFSQQWHHVQDEDHDIDTDLAWDVTTGGFTATNDEIVVCVVETGGADWDQADIVDNHWINENEIPDNGQDDDGNGYVDDYHGWNIQSGSDEVDNGNHGTQVSSMIGAKGDNNTGVTGVNWDVKIMQVEMGGVTEANVIEAYEYPLKMRKLYNQSGGTLGAFIVATNSSWGTDNGQPADAPLWCAMYDSLGVHGVLSCGATSNSNVNVDVVGDLPTACPSEFLLSVGRSNSSDVRASGGYGLTTIDLMAPGDNVYLANNSGYGITTGTSFSSPCVAGAIALLYSAPCTSLMEIVALSAEDGASMIKQYILDGVDQTTQLLDETVSGGRMNVNNSLQLLLTECEGSSCIAPFAINIVQEPGTLNYTVSWSATSEAEEFALRYRIQGNSQWTVISDIAQNSIILDELSACETYEIELMTACEGEESSWGNTIILETDGCCENPNSYQLTSQGSTTATLEWNEILAASTYTLHYSEEGGEWVIIENIIGNGFTLTGLDSCTTYSVIVYAVCEGVKPAFTTFDFNTSGCGTCEDLQYCEVSADAGQEYIANVTIGDINRTSGSDGGYILVEDETTTLVAAQEYSISCTPGFSGFEYSEYFRVWIDYNANGLFDEPAELVFSSGSSSPSTVSGQFTIPLTVADGVVRMRVGMSYVGQFGGGAPPESCGDNDYGETEDYCVELDGDVSVGEKQAALARVYPNPANDQLTIFISGYSLKENISYEIIDGSGRTVASMKNPNGQAIDISHLSAGFYGVRIKEGNHGVIRFVKQ